MSDKVHWLNRAKSRWARTYRDWIGLHACIAIILFGFAAALFANGTPVLGCMLVALGLLFVGSVIVCLNDKQGSD